MKRLEIFKEKFDPYLKDYLKKKILEIRKYTKNKSVIDYINYAKKITLIGGKRIRPYIAYLMYGSLGGKDIENALKLLVSLEIFHSFGLMHDDIIDKGTLRHGIPTSHIYITNKLKKEKRVGDLNHIGNSQAILLGDILFSWALENLSANIDFSPKIINNVIKLFYQMVDEVIIGQMIDVDITTRKKVPKEFIDEKIRLKTASYTFIRPLEIGASLANGLTTSIEKFCQTFGFCLGIAFQTQDDLFDTTSTKNKLHKTVLSDVIAHQHTYLTQLGIKQAREIIKNNFKTAKDLIVELPIEKNYKQKFFNLVKIIEERKS